MKTMRAVLFTALAVVTTTSCTSTPVDPNPWGGISPGDSFLLGEGSSIEVRRDDVQTTRVRVEDGHLILNGRDLGPYDGSEPLRFLEDGTLTVGGQVRGHIDPAAE